MKFHWVAVLTGIFLNAGCSPSQASSISSETSAGSASQTEGLSYNGTPEKKSEQGWNWTLGYTYSQTSSNLEVSPVPGASPSPSVTDHTHEGTVGLGYKRDWEAGGGFAYSSTAEESLKDYGPNVYLGYTLRLGTASTLKTAHPKKETSSKKKIETDEEDEAPNGVREPTPGLDDGESEGGAFRQSLGFRATFTGLKYVEEFNATSGARKSKKRVNKVGSDEITQTSGAFEVTYSPLEWMSLKAVYTGYSYSKDVNAFISFLDLPKSIKIGASNFATTLGGFPSQTLEGELFVNPSELWELEGTYTRTTTAADGSHGLGIKFLAAREVGENWKIGLGLEHDESSGEVQNLGLLNLNYDF